MAITIGADALWRQITLTHFDKAQERVTKEFIIDPTVSDALIIAMLTAYETLSNMRTSKAKIAGRKISGMRNAVLSAPYDLIGIGAVLTFEQPSPENADLTLTKVFIIPTPVQTLFQSDNVTLKEPDSGGDAQQIALNTVVTFCQSYLVSYIKSADVAVVGGFVYKPAKSRLITTLRDYDGQIG